MNHQELINKLQSHYLGIRPQTHYISVNRLQLSEFVIQHIDLYTAIQSDISTRMWQYRVFFKSALQIRRLQAILMGFFLELFLNLPPETKYYQHMSMVLEPLILVFARREILEDRNQFIQATALSFHSCETPADCLYYYEFLQQLGFELLQNDVSDHDSCDALFDLFQANLKDQFRSLHDFFTEMNHHVFREEVKKFIVGNCQFLTYNCRTSLLLAITLSLSPRNLKIEIFVQIFAQVMATFLKSHQVSKFGVNPLSGIRDLTNHQVWSSERKIQFIFDWAFETVLVDKSYEIIEVVIGRTIEKFHSLNLIQQVIIQHVPVSLI